MREGWEETGEVKAEGEGGVGDEEGEGEEGEAVDCLER